MYKCVTAHALPNKREKPYISICIYVYVYGNEPKVLTPKGAAMSTMPPCVHMSRIWPNSKGPQLDTIKLPEAHCVALVKSSR